MIFLYSIVYTNVVFDLTLRRIIIGTLIGSLMSIGLAIGLIYGGIQVSWWLALILCVIGFLIGGFTAGFIARDMFPGFFAGLFTGLIVFLGIFLFTWLIIRAKILNWFASFSDIGQTINAFLDFIGISTTSTLGQNITSTITTKYSEYGSDIDQLVQKYVPLFCLVVSAIFGGSAVFVGAIAGAIGGRFNKVDEILNE